jgi:hypothetical protein
MEHQTTRQMSIHIESRPMLVAGQLRRFFEQRGFIALPGGKSAPDTGFTVAITPIDRTACWLIPDIIDAVPEELGQLLSELLQCRVTSVAVLGSIQAYEISDRGRPQEKLAVDGDNVLDDLNSPYHSEVIAGETIATCLERSGLVGALQTYSDAIENKRTLRLSFAPKERIGMESIEIDPTLSCPLCGSAMRKNTGRYGVFWGCVRFPACRGRLTEKQAAASRKK